MSVSEPSRRPDAPPGQQDARLREIQAVLADCQVDGTAPRVLKSDTWEDGDTYAWRLANALRRLGPCFATFGRYMASRTDMLALDDCLALAQIVDRAEPMPGDQILELVTAEVATCFQDEEDQLGTEPTDRDAKLVRVERDACESRLLLQWHQGTLSNGDEVVIRVVRPDVNFERDLASLPALWRAFEPRLRNRAVFDHAIREFRESLDNLLDCRVLAKSLESLRHDQRDFPELRVPAVYKSLTTRRVLTTQRLVGRKLSSIIEEREKVEGADPTDTLLENIARQLSSVWLRQAFEGSMVPVDPLPENILVVSPTEIAFVDGTFEVLPVDARDGLLEYLVETAANEPGKALERIMHEMDGTQSRVTHVELERSFRQIIPFRDGGWDDDGRVNCLSETLIGQWRVLTTSGYRPLPHLIPFMRGVFQVSSTTRRLTSRTDALEEGVKDLRVHRVMREMRTILEPSYWNSQLDRIGAMAAHSPQHLNDSLSIAAGMPLTPQLERNVKTVRTRWPFMLVILSMLVGIIVLSEHLAAYLGPRLSEQASATAFILFGMMMLHSLVRRAQPS